MTTVVETAAQVCTTLVTTSFLFILIPIIAKEHDTKADKIPSEQG
jgi:hypothetical protein